VVVEHRDRLGRVNTELAEAALSASGHRLVVPGPAGVGLYARVSSHGRKASARLYGRRSARDRAEEALRCAACDVGPASAEAAG
jgi:putative resolvase